MVRYTIEDSPTRSTLTGGTNHKEHTVKSGNITNSDSIDWTSQVKMFRSKTTTQQILATQQPRDWTAVYHQYFQNASEVYSLAKQYLRGMERWSADRVTSANDLMRIMNVDAMVDIIVGGTARKYYLLHNIHVYNVHGNFRIWGISERSLDSKYWEITGITSNSFFAKAEKVLPANRGEQGARLWVNAELSRMNKEYAEEEG